MDLVWGMGGWRSLSHNLVHCEQVISAHPEIQDQQWQDAEGKVLRFFAAPPQPAQVPQRQVHPARHRSPAAQPAAYLRAHHTVGTLCERVADLTCVGTSDSCLRALSPELQACYRRYCPKPGFSRFTEQGRQFRCLCSVCVSSRTQAYCIGAYQVCV